MFDEFDLEELFDSTGPSHLRSQALDLFDRCLTQNDPALMIAFIERHVVQDPPPLHLLRAIEEDLQQRLHSLRTHRFDIRSRVIQVFADSTHIDIVPLMPADALEQYHLLQSASIMEYVKQCSTSRTDMPTAQEMLLLHKLLEASIEAVDRLQTDIRLTMQVHKLVIDWLEALSSTNGRRNWSDAVSPDAMIH